MKVGVRVIGDGFARAEALVADVHRRALERLQARIAAERDAPRREADTPPVTKPPAR